MDVTSSYAAASRSRFAVGAISDPRLAHEHDRLDESSSTFLAQHSRTFAQRRACCHHGIDQRDPPSAEHSCAETKGKRAFTARQRSRSAQCRTEGTDRICTRNGGVRSSTRTPGRRAGMRPGRSRSADGRDGPIDHVRTALAQSGPWAPVTSILITIIKTFLPFPTDLMIVANGASSGFGVTSSCR
jgi:hypothetical protein